MKIIPKNNVSSLIKSYNKLYSKLKKSIKSGQFANWSKQKKQYLIARLLQLLKSLKTNGVRVAGGLGIALLTCLSAHAQVVVEFDEPFENECAVSPFEGLDLIPLSIEEEDDDGGEYTRQVLTGDLDNDGDEDLLVISFSINFGHYLQYFENNEGTLIELEGEDNPLEVFNEFAEDEGFPPFLVFALGDATLNGRLDLVLGELKGTVYCFANTEGGFEDPVDKDFIDENEDVLFNNVSFANIDDDCEQELIVTPAFIFEEENEGEEEEPVYTSVYDIVDGEYISSPGMVSMFDNIYLNEEDLISHYFFDIEGDGLDELIVVNYGYDNPSIDLYAKEDGNYVQVLDNPFEDFEFGEDEDGFIFPIFDFGDLDGDGNLNMYLGFKSDEAEISEELYCFESNIPYAPACTDPDPNAAVPTLSQWGLIILSLVFLIFGILGIKESSARSFLGLKAKQKI